MHGTSDDEDEVRGAPLVPYSINSATQEGTNDHHEDQQHYEPLFRLSTCPHV